MNRSPLVRALLTSAALGAAVALAGCETDGTQVPGKALKPISPQLLSEMAQKDMTKESPILIRMFKQESELEVWKADKTGQFALLKTFPICRWSGELGPKIKEGDRQAPEGFYTVTPGQMNPNSSLYLSFNMGFPNAFDQAHGRTGTHLMVHGDCSSRGCYSMTDEQISEIYALGRESFFGGQRAFQVQAFPFRMTPVNMAKHRNNPHMPFWKMLKEGYDHFEVTRREPKVDVCEKRYVFNAKPSDSGARFEPRAQCPVYEVPSEIVAAVAERNKKDETAVATLIKRGTPAAPVKMGTDGGMHQVFAEVLQGGRAVRGKDGEIELVKVSAPGTIPAHVNPPSNVVIGGAAAATAAPAAAATPAPAVTQPSSPPPSNSAVARAPAQPAAKPAQPATAAQPTQTAALNPAERARNFFSNLFTRNPTQASAAPAAAPAAKPTAPRGSTTPATAATTQPASPPPAKPKPTAVAEAKPKPEPEESAAPGLANAGAVRPQSPVSAFIGSPANSNPGLLTGAAPVVPTGSFGTNWPSVR